MTKTEILEKSNSYKIEYNIAHKNVDKNFKTLNFLNRFKNFFKSRKEATKSIKNKLLVFAIILTPITIATLFSSLSIGIILTIISGIFWERFNFFNYVNKKFTKCFQLFDKLTKDVNIKQNDCLMQQEHIMAEIIALEKAIPDDIKDVISILDNENNDIEDNLELTM